MCICTGMSILGRKMTSTKTKLSLLISYVREHEAKRANGDEPSRGSVLAWNCRDALAHLEAELGETFSEQAKDDILGL